MALTIAATLKDARGVAIQNGRLRITLGGYGAVIPRVAGSNIIASTAPIELQADASGLIAATAITGNNTITPAGTFYTVQVLDANQNPVQTNDYQFNGANPLDLSNLAPYNPPPPSAPSLTGIPLILAQRTILDPAVGASLGIVIPQRSNANAFYEVLASGQISSTAGTGGVALRVTLPGPTIISQEVTVAVAHTRMFLIAMRFGITVASYWSSSALYNDISSGPGVADVESIGPYDFTQITNFDVIASRSFLGSIRLDYLVTRVNW